MEFWFFWDGLLTLIMAVPFGASLVYIFISLRQLTIATKENSPEKKSGAIKAFLLALFCTIVILVVYFWLILR